MDQKKLNLAFIVPTSFIQEFASQGDFILALAHLIPENGTNDYQVEIVKTGLPIILDNGLFENHQAVGILELLNKALKIGAETVFVPDVLYNKEATASELDHAIVFKENVGARDVKLGAVPQADNIPDYIEQLVDFNSNPYVDLIGLSILSIPHSYRSKFGGDITKSRIALLEEMIAMTQFGIKWKPCHLLGLGDSYEDVIFAKEHCSWVVSNDTSSAFQSGLYNKELDENLEVPGGKVKEKVDFDLKGITETQRRTIQKNITKIKKKLK